MCEGIRKDDPLLNHYQDNIVKNSAHGIFPVAFALSCNSIKINKEESATMMLYGSQSAWSALHSG